MVYVIRGKYARHGFSQDSLAVTSADSSLWKALVEIWPNIVNGEFWTVGNGNSVDVWHDKWEDRDLRLVEYLHRTPFNTNITVKDLVDAGGNWDLQFLQQLFPMDRIHQITAILPPRQDAGEDMCLWPGDRLGNFSVSSAYCRIQNFHILVEDADSKRIWNIKAIERVRAFIWQLKHNRCM